MHKKIFDKELFVSVSLLSLLLCATIGFFLLAEIFYSKSAKSEDIDTRVVVYLCGNNVLESVEVCDGTALGGEFCQSLGYDFGTLACKSDCSGYDTTSCYTYDMCGNELQEEGEFCDGSDLAGRTCLSFGYDGGDLACSPDCGSYDYDDCTIEIVPTSVCGNNTQELGELCDGPDLGGKICTSFGFNYGSLNCASSCDAFDTSGCKTYPVSPVVQLCGNNQLDGNEPCDGNLLNDETCESLGFDAGYLDCSADCRTFDTSGCYTALEVCDNEKDDDDNGFADCFDLGCMATDECLSGVKELCYNGIDDDQDSYVDCFDADCLGYEYCLNKLGENCGNEVDDNGNAQIDCEDDACLTHQLCYEKEPTEEPEKEEPIDILPETGEKAETSKFLIIGLVVGLLLLVALIIFFIVWKRKKKEQDEGEDKDDVEDDTPGSLDDSNKGSGDELMNEVPIVIEPPIAPVPMQEVPVVDDDDESPEWTFEVELLPDGETLEIPEDEN